MIVTLVHLKPWKTIPEPHLSFSWTVCNARKTTFSVLYETSRCCSALSYEPPSRLFTRASGSVPRQRLRISYMFINILWVSLHNHKGVRGLTSCDAADTVSCSALFPARGAVPGSGAALGPDRAPPGSRAASQARPRCLCCWSVRTRSCPHFKSQTLNSVTKRLSSARAFWCR